MRYAPSLQAIANGARLGFSFGDDAKGMSARSLQEDDPVICSRVRCVCYMLPFLVPSDHFCTTTMKMVVGL